MLPDDILAHVLSFVPPNQLYDKFIRPYKSLDHQIQKLAYTCIFQYPIVVKNRAQKELESQRFGPSSEGFTAFELDDFQHGYSVLVSLMRNNIAKSVDMLFPPEVTLSFVVMSHSDIEIDQFSKLLEVLAFDNYYQDAIPKINVTIWYNVAPGVLDRGIRNHNKILQRIQSLGRKMNKISITNRARPIQERSRQSKSQSQSPPPLHILYPLGFSNLTTIHLVNNGIQGSFKQDLRNTTPHLQILDIRSNNVTSLRELSLPKSLLEFLISSNTLTSLSGPNWHELIHLHTLDASINAIATLDDVRVLPIALKHLKLDYNSIHDISRVHLPRQLETLSLSKNNNLNIFEDFGISSDLLPNSLLEIYLDGNNIKSLPQDLFENCNKLMILSLAENGIDDPDDLGSLPDSLQELILDDNEIDYLDWDNILTPNLNVLSMSSTGLISLEGVTLPPTLKKFNLSGNQISSLDGIQFPIGLETLKLNHNKLSQFQFQFQTNLTTLDLSYNNVVDVNDLELPDSLESLTLAGLMLGSIDNKLLSKLPKGLRDLDISDIGETGILNCDFDQFNQLERLYLDNNRITSIDVQTKFPQTLKHLSMDSNLIGFDALYKEFPKNLYYLSVNRTHDNQRLILQNDV
ncbi:hypothetical protein CAAN1_10S00914 [[Candida] anglica]|uniref:F-box domain-containing protein n=1 Tax=[Candida] anglica TaxID=148631 RepID=A0ABP0EHS2_9ASCO